LDAFWAAKEGRGNTFPTAGSPPDFLGVGSRIGTELPPRAEKASRFALMAASVAVLRGILGDGRLAMGLGACRIRLRGVIGLTLSLWGIIYSSI
jgi:hypothetical protein